MNSASVNEWLVYTCEPKLALVRIASRDVGPSDPRRTASWQVRNYLLPAMLDTAHLAGNEDSLEEQIIELKARRIIRPIRSPHTQAVVCFVAGIFEEGIEPPHPQ